MRRKIQDSLNLIPERLSPSDLCEDVRRRYLSIWQG